MEDVNLRSEEVQEILGTPPTWIVRNGTLIAALFFITLVTLSAVIPYPTVQEAEITIAFTDPPRTLVAPNAGTIDEIFVRNNERVVKDKALLIFKDPAEYNHVLALQDYLENIPNDNDSIMLALEPPYGLTLGEIQEDFLDYTEKRNQYFRQTEQFTSDVNVDSYRSQISSLQRSNRYLERQKEVIASQIDGAVRERNILENRLSRGEASQAEVNQIVREIRDYRAEMQSIESRIQDNNFDVELLQNKIATARQGDSRSRINASDDLKTSFLRLKIRVNQWVESNVIVAPIDGIVEVNENIGEQQFIQAQDPVMIVIPTESRNLIGKMKLEFKNSGLVETGQPVIIKLTKYPFEQYGAIRGLVSWKSKVPDDKNMVQVQVMFPDNLLTTTGKSIEPEEELFGKADIITGEKYILQQIIDYGKSSLVNTFSSKEKRMAPLFEN